MLILTRTELAMYNALRRERCAAGTLFLYLTDELSSVDAVKTHVSRLRSKLRRFNMDVTFKRGCYELVHLTEDD